MNMQEFSPLILLVLLLVVFYFILIRPQKKKEKALQDMISKLKVGDGIHGKIAKVRDNLFVLETGIGTTKSFISIEKSAIARLISEGTSKDAKNDEDDEPETETAAEDK